MILAIDCGSTSFKAAVVERRLNVRGIASARLDYHFASGGKVELAVEDVSTAFRKAVAGALRAAGVKAALLQAIAITSQAQTFTVFDRRGCAKMRFISWQDNRAGAASATLKKTVLLADFADHCSFGEPLAALQVCQIKHLQQTRPGFIRPGDLLLKLPTYFVWRLTGEPVMDDNLAAMSGLYSLVLGHWWPAALKACGIRREQLPRVIPVGSVAARTTAAARAFGLPEGISVVLAGNDQTAGAYGAQLDRNNALLLTLGTAQVAYVCLRRMPVPHAALVRGPYPGGRAYRLAADGCGGNIINWAQSVLAHCESDEKFFAQAARSKRGSRGLVFEPTLDNGTGVWRNVALHHTPADFARSVIEALSRRMAAMVRTLGVSPRRHKVLAAGGGSQSALFVRIVSEAIGAAIHVTTASPLLGAARMALKAILH
ncbi:MAG: FGGY family carbohydrate kinase [Verrucomicrobiae bacterium]|nr:FGGY family carbohydrate kinase [Verrucomicrobiae bacterium]